MPFPTHLPFVDSLPATAEMIDARSGQLRGRDAIAEAVAARATAIAALGLPPRGRVVVARANGADALIDLFAVWAAGQTAVLVNPGLAPPERANVIAHTQAAAWLGDDGDERVGVAGAAKPARPLGPDEAALILMTSGTTGIPKGIVHTLRSLLARCALNIAHIGAADLDRALCVLPVFFGHGLIGNCLTPLAAGRTLVLWNTPSVAEIGGFAEVLETHKITFMSSVPTFWKLALRLDPPERSRLRRVHLGSAPLAVSQCKAVADWCGTPNVHNMFGMTETANWIGGGALAQADGRDGYVGRIWGGAYAVRDDEGAIHRSGRGEVLVASPTIMTHYLAAPELTDAAFDRGWFRTGDIGELDDDGALTLVGRIKSEINRAGIKILAEEIDMLLERHPAIAEACAFGVPDPVAGEAVGAAIVLAADMQATLDEIRSWCRENVRAEAVPSRLFVVEAIARNDRGKIVRSVVRDAALSGAR